MSAAAAGAILMLSCIAATWTMIGLAYAAGWVWQRMKGNRMTLERFDFADWGEDGAGMDPEPDGKYVLYEDVARVIAALERAYPVIVDKATKEEVGALLNEIASSGPANGSPKA